MVMKNGHIIFLAASVLMLALGSCTKETVEEGLAGEELVAVGGERLITLSFGESTRATLDGLTPHFSAGDRILVSSGSAKEICTVVLDDDGTPTISTSLSGTLNAVYPVEAAVLSGSSITGITVPAVQSGKFSDALIATANNIGSSNTATFESQTAILRFYVDKNIGLQSVSVTSSATDIATGSRSITVSASSGSTLDAVSDDPKRRLCYVSVLTGVNANTLTFSGLTSTQGLVTKPCTVNAALAAGKVYNAFIPYYIDMGAGGKWAYCNIGAFLPEEPGLYFAWADTVGYSSGHSFSESNAPYYGGSFSYSKYNSTDRKDILEPADDAATVNWGAGWRMPSGDINNGVTELSNLQEITYWGYYSGSYGSVNPPGLYVFLPADAPGKSAGNYGSVDGLDLSKAKLFFPLTGNKYDAVHTDQNSGCYWSRVLFDYAYSSRAWCMQFNASSADCKAFKDRKYGLCIRPVYDDTIHPVDSNPMIDGGTY